MHNKQGLAGQQHMKHYNYGRGMYDPASSDGKGRKTKNKKEGATGGSVGSVTPVTSPSETLTGRKTE